MMGCWEQCAEIVTSRWLNFPPPTSQVRATSSLQVLAYKVTLKTPGGEQTIECADDVYILDAAEEAGELSDWACNVGGVDGDRFTPYLNGIMAVIFNQRLALHNYWVTFATSCVDFVDTHHLHHREGCLIFFSMLIKCRHWPPLLLPRWRLLFLRR